MKSRKTCRRASAVAGEGARATAYGFPGRRERGENHEWIFPVAGGEPPWVGGLPGRWLSAEEMLRRRIQAGLPAIPTDLGPADLPNEGGLEAEAISYTKGCYLGQEVMARLKSMGQVRRRLVRVAGSGENFPTLPAPLFGAGRSVGELRSAVRDGQGGWIGLAMVSLLHVSPGAQLAWAVDQAPTIRLGEAP